MRAASLYLGSLLLAAAGCEKTDPLFCKENPGATGCPTPDGDIGDDMGDLDMEPGIDARLCYGAGNGAICATSAPAAQITFTNPGTFDTSPGASTNPMCLAVQPTEWKMAGHQDACFLFGTTITVNANLTVVGSRPLVLVAPTIAINASLDVGGNGATPAAGAPDPSCSFKTMPVNNTDGGGGGAGGTFMSQGGAGGAGDNGNYAAGTPADPETADPVLLRAGCSGQKGGSGQAGGNGGNGGGGGGALYVLAGDSITIGTGVTVTVSGGGGARAGRQGGGGGGGAGGMLWFYAPSISAAGALIMANGGGGSSGGDDSGATDGGGEAGHDATAPDAAAAGGAGTDTAGNGGDGYYNDGADHDATPGGIGGSSNRGGGGGGGGRGFIQTNTALAGATVSPTPAMTQ